MRTRDVTHVPVIGLGGRGGLGAGRGGVLGEEVAGLLGLRRLVLFELVHRFGSLVVESVVLSKLGRPL